MEIQEEKGGNFMATLSGEEMIEKGFQAMEKNNKYMAKNYKKIEKEFGGKIVAVSNGEIKCWGKTTAEVIKKLKKDKIDPNTVLIEFVPEAGEIILF